MELIEDTVFIGIGICISVILFGVWCDVLKTFK